MPYQQRQNRLNHYHFGCKCEVCLRDARLGSNIRCAQCSGPVVFDSALNQDPSLNGKCLLCYGKQTHFEQTTQQLTNMISSLKSTKSIGLLMAMASEKSALIGRTAEWLYSLTELSLPCSKAVGQGIIDGSNLIENCGSQVDLPLQDKLRLALFMHRNLLDHLKNDAHS